ncbi:MAG: hypothetical protein KGI54_13970 [Pseudomonadota bacterium]|nr:hypothetical protein [Pseudomonadota bacterium]
MKTSAKFTLFLTSIMMFTLSAAANADGTDTSNAAYSKTVHGITMYLGVMPARIILKQYQKASPEAQMHGGLPLGGNNYHVMIALFNSINGKRITDAKPMATVREIGLSGETKKLQTMTIAGATTYGNYFTLPDSDTNYRIDLAIRLPGQPAPIHAEFTYRLCNE